MMDYEHWNDGWGGGWWWIPMMVMMIAFWGGLIWIGIALVKRNNHTAQQHTPAITPPATAPTAQEILAHRLARGEIEPDDYRQRLDALNHTAGK